MAGIENFERPPAGWFLLEVMRREARVQDWVALMIDVDPDQHLAGRKARECWVRIPGKHGSRDAAYDAFDDLMTTRH